MPLQREKFDRSLTEAYDREYRRANDAVWLSDQWQQDSLTMVSRDLPIKDVKPGFQTLRLVLQSEEQLYIGSKRIYVLD